MALLRRVMEFGYKAAVRFSETYGAAHYNLGIAEQGDADLGQAQARMVHRLLGDTRIERGTVLADVGAGIGGALYQLVEAFHPRLAVGIELCWPNIECGVR